MSPPQQPRLFAGSKFKEFSIQLADGGTLTGIYCCPPRTAVTPSSVPLLVGVHGGTCTAHNYDIDRNHTASLASYALGIPFVAINRPDYGGTSPLTPCENYHLECAHWLHKQALPAVWAQFGTGCSAIVVTAHSMGTPVAIIAAALRADEEAASKSQSYPLAGLILSGYGFRPNPERGENSKLAPPEAYPPVLNYSRARRTELMLSKPSLALCDPEMYQLVIDQMVGMRREELLSGIGWFKEPEVCGEYCAGVKLPILYGLGELDFLCEGSESHMQEIKAMFKKCPRFEGSIIGSGPHALEWAKIGQGWYVKCFGWATEVTVHFDNRKTQSKI